MTDHQRFKLHIILIDADDQKFIPEFHTPLVHYLNPLNENVNVDIQLDDDKLILRRNDQSSIKFQRPSYCPFTNLCIQQKSSLLIANPANAIAVGVVILFESHDRFILLTRRASHMRTFPSCWVCPGGGIEKGETLLQAGIRELKEEVGVEVNEKEMEQSDILALWESSYPADLEHGLPRRHHIVVYVHVRSMRLKSVFNVHVDPNEVDAYTWLSFEQIGALSHQTEVPNSLETFDAYVNSQGFCKLPFKILEAADHNQSENLTNGTRFALQRWYIAQSKSESLIGAT